MAPNTIDYSGYPDCRPEYFDQITKTLHYGSKLGTEHGIGSHIETPIIGLSKSDIVKMGVAWEPRWIKHGAAIMQERLRVDPVIVAYSGPKDLTIPECATHY